MTRKAKRKLSNIDFETEGSHIALVSKQQGGPASGADYALVMKAKGFSQEFIEKVQQVRVTMELPDFLRKFFSLYGEDAEILARMMGYEYPESEEKEVAESYEDYIESRMEAFEIIKAAYETDNLASVLSELDEDEYIALLKDQEQLEKAFELLEKAYKPKVGDMVEWNSSGGKVRGKIEHVMTEGTLGVPNTEFSIKATKENPAALIRIYRDGEPTETLVGHKASTLKKTAKVKKESKLSASYAEADDTSPASEVNDKEVSASINKENLEKSKMDENQKEMVEKATLDLLQKSFDEQKEALEKALETLAQFEAEKKAAIEKARKDQVVAAVKDAAKAEVLFKAVKDASDEDFQAVVKTLTEMQESVEKSALFEEQGASAQEEPVIQESAVAKLLKAKQAVK